MGEPIDEANTAADLRVEVQRLRSVAEALGAHAFEGVALGVADRPCTSCGKADRHPIHQAHVTPLAPQERETAAEREARVHNHFGIDVDAGPVCKCGHARNQHVGEKPLLDGGTPMSFFDGPCQVDGCTGCAHAGYIPGDGRTYTEVAPLYGAGWSP